MNTAKQLGKIESQLKAFTMTEDVENLTKASAYLMDLISYHRHQDAKTFHKRFHDKLQVLLTK
jgi:hypothetical protein